MPAKKLQALVPVSLAPALALALLAGPVSAPRPAAAQRPDSEAIKQMKQDPKQLLEVVRAYLTMVGEIRDTVADPLRTQIFVQQDMKEIYEKLGKPADVIKDLRTVLETLRDPDARIAVRMAIVDALKNSGKPEEALAELRLVLKENETRFRRK